MKNFETNWKKSIARKPKLRLFKQWKMILDTPKYITLNLSRQQRSLLAQLRSGSLPLHIETGRYTGLKADERICKFCTNNVSETEYHFLFHCNLYHDIRTAFFIDWAPKPNAQNQCEIVVKLFADSPRALAKYVNDIFNARKIVEYPML